MKSWKKKSILKIISKKTNRNKKNKDKILIVEKNW